MAITVTDATGKEVTIEGLDSARQPVWTGPELEVLRVLFCDNGPYKDRDYSQFFRHVQKSLPHRTLSGALERIHDAQVNQEVPYYGALPMQDARTRDKTNSVSILYALAEWKQKQAAQKKDAKRLGAVDTVSEETAGTIIQLLTAQNKILADCHKFLAGIYRRVCGDDGRYVQVEIVQEPSVMTLDDVNRQTLTSIQGSHLNPVETTTERSSGIPDGTCK